MENRDRTQNQAGQGQGGKPNQGGSQQGGQGQAAHPRQGAYKYKGGRQGTGGIPNPDDQDDSESAGSFRGTADHGPDTEDKTRNPD